MRDTRTGVKKGTFLTLYSEACKKAKNIGIGIHSLSFGFAPGRSPCTLHNHPFICLYALGRVGYCQYSVSIGTTSP